MIPELTEGRRIVATLMDWLQIPINDQDGDTPKRVAQMYLEVFNGLYTDAPEPKLFKANSGYICVTDISFSSMCEHHLLPFFGKCGVVYWTDSGMVLGLSKIARIVEWCSARPQLQEKLTEKIAQKIGTIPELEVKGVYVVMSAEHTCMTMRGIKAMGSITNTAVMAGDIDKEEAIQLLTAQSLFKD